MSSNQTPDIGEPGPVQGVRLGTVSAGIRKPGRPDLVVIEVDDAATCAGVFTQNQFCAAPVIVAKEHLASASPRYLLVNTGNANAGTGAQGQDDCMRCCLVLAQLCECDVAQVVPFSTGVIGESLPVGKIVDGIPAALGELSETGWSKAATGILTTDTVPKLLSRKFDINQQSVTITAMAKGSGMIRPDMATMLAFIATDLSMDDKLLQQCLRNAVDRSFNRITVDGDTSTNDACVLIATGKSELPRITREAAEYDLFAQVLTEVCEELARAIVRDGEGATKLVTITVEGGQCVQECGQAAYTIAHSPLVKTALFASDPNWGRILAALGRAGIQELDISKVDIYIGDVCIVQSGSRAPAYTEEQGQAEMQGDEISIRVALGRGDASDRVWTCDLSYDYVRINAEYRT